MYLIKTKRAFLGVCVSSAGVPETDCGTPVHRQADRLSGSHAAAG